MASTVDLEIEYGVSRSTIRRLLRQAGCTLRGVREASRVRPDAAWARLARPGPVGGAVVVTDAFGVVWRVTHATPTTHGFDVLRGLLATAREGSPSIILTSDLAAHIERHRLAPRNLALPMGEMVIRRLRRQLGMDWPSETLAWWRDRLVDLRDLSPKNFAAKYGVRISAVYAARGRHCPKPISRHDWKDPAIRALVLSGRPIKEIAVALNVSPRYIELRRGTLRRAPRRAGDGGASSG